MNYTCTFAYGATPLFTLLLGATGVYFFRMVAAYLSSEAFGYY